MIGIIAGAVVILICAVIFLVIVIGNGKDKSTDELLGVENETGEELPAPPEIGGSESETETEAAVFIPLEMDAYPEINALFTAYYTAAAKGDIDTIQTLQENSSQTELLQIREKSKYMEGYEDIKCYTKPGPTADSFVVYVTYYARFTEIEQRVCGLSTYVVRRNEQGSYYIYDCENDEAMKEYRTNVTRQDDVVELFNQIQVEYNETVTSNEEISAFLTDLSSKLKAAVGDALAEAEKQNGGGAPEETAAFTPYRAKANDVVNIRKSDSQNSESLGKAQVGEEFFVLENRANGWSRVEYKGGEAFIKSEFLDGEPPVSAETGTGAESGAENNTETGSTGNAASGNANVPDSGKFRLGDSVNVRKSPSQSADRIGVAYEGEEIEIIEKQSDGWTKVKFKGSTGYIKTEVLK